MNLTRSWFRRRSAPLAPPFGTVLQLTDSVGFSIPTGGTWYLAKGFLVRTLGSIKGRVYVEIDGPTTYSVEWPHPGLVVWATEEEWEAKLIEFEETAAGVRRIQALAVRRERDAARAQQAARVTP